MYIYIWLSNYVDDIRNKYNGLRQWFKTEVELISTGKMEERIGPQLKYLIVILESRLKFNEHLAYTSEKVNKKYKVLSRMMAKSGCMRFRRRFLITKVMSSVILYSALI